MTLKRRSPIPYLTALAGLLLGGGVGALIGAVLCPDCDLPIAYAGALVGAVVGGLLGGVAGLWALRLGAPGRIGAVAAAAFVLGGAAGAWVGVELWQRAQRATVLERPPLCEETPRPAWCSGPRGRPREVHLRGSNDIPPSVAIPSGLGAGILGAAAAGAFEARHLRRRESLARRGRDR